MDYVVLALAWLVSLGFAVAVSRWEPNLAEMATIGYAGLFLVSVPSAASLVLAGPNVVLTVLAGRYLDPLASGLVAGTGTTVGELTGYVIGYTTRSVAPRVGIFGRVARFLEAASQTRVRFSLILFALALIPNPFFDVACIAAGWVKMPLVYVIPSIWIGKTLRFLGYAYLGRELLR